MEGYYISNSDTGIISKCRENCFSCINGPKRDENGNLESMECSECNEPQSMNKSMIQMDNNCFKIIIYEEKQILFDISEINSDE